MPIYMYFPFLYFPKDKIDYLPAAISMFFFMLAAVLFFRFMVRLSNKQAQEAKEFEQNLQMKMNQDEPKESSVDRL